MIAQRINFRAAQSLASRNLQSIIPFFHLRSHGTEVGGDGRNPVRLFDPQLARIPNLDPACEGLNIIRTTQPTAPRIVIKNSSGFGGANVCLVFKTAG